MKRYYLAITNHCNRSCEICCTFSGPEKRTFLPFSWIENYLLASDDEYEAQLEGGEPVIHPDYYRIIDFLNNDVNCIRIILTTNSTLFPYIYDENYKLDREKSFNTLLDYFQKIKKPFILKPSVNHYLIERDSNLLDKIEVLRDVINKIDDFSILLNVRKRKDGDQPIIDELEKRSLLSISNIFFFQKYGKAKDDSDYEPPFIIENPVEFYLISPDEKVFLYSPNCLTERSEHMEGLN